MSDDLINAYITLLIITGWLTLLIPVVNLIVAHLPPDLLERIRYGKFAQVNSRYGRPRNLKVDRQVFLCKTDAAGTARIENPSAKAAAPGWPGRS